MGTRSNIKILNAKDFERLYGDILEKYKVENELKNIETLNKKSVKDFCESIKIAIQTSASVAEFLDMINKEKKKGKRGLKWLKQKIPFMVIILRRKKEKILKLILFH